MQLFTGRLPPQLVCMRNILLQGQAVLHIFSLASTQRAAIPPQSIYLLSACKALTRMINATLCRSPSRITPSGPVSAYIAHSGLCASSCVDLVRVCVCMWVHPVRAADVIKEHVDNTTPPVLPLVDDHTAAVWAASQKWLSMNPRSTPLSPPPQLPLYPDRLPSSQSIKTEGDSFTHLQRYRERPG